MEDIPTQLIEYAKLVAPTAISVVILVVAFQIVKGVVYTRLRKADDINLVDAIADRLESMGWTTALVSGLYLGTYLTSEVGEAYSRFVYFLFIIVWGWQIMQLIMRLINFMIERAIRKGGESSTSTYRFLGLSLKFLLWVVVALLILSNLGYDVNSLVAGLGITGIAVALAVQSILSDFISSFSIVSDKPFRVGDFIIVGGYRGTVEQIGIRSTRVKSLDGENLVIPNSEMVKSIVQNYGDIEQRRAAHTIGVTYDTEKTLLRDVPVFIMDIIKAHDKIDPESGRVNMVEYGDSSINFEVVFEVMTSEYPEFLNVQQEVLFSINDKFIEEEIQFAFPSRTIYTHVASDGN